MDPNNTLQRIRELVGKPNYPIELDTAWDDLTELVESLDDWLSRGGFLPEDWDRKENRTS